MYRSKENLFRRRRQCSSRIMEVCIVLVTFVTIIYGLPIQDTELLSGYFQPCRRSDPQLNECIRSSLNILIRNLKSGVNELGLPPIDPLEVPFLELDSNNGNLTLKLTLKNNVIKGITHTNVTSVKASLADCKFEVASKTTFFEIQGEFSYDGAVLSIPLHSSGNFFVNMTDVTAVWIIYYHEESLERGLPSNFKIDDFGLDIIPTDIKFDFGRQLDDDNELGQAMDRFLNGNSHEIFNDVKPQIIRILSETFSEYGNAILATFSAKTIFPVK